MFGINIRFLSSLAFCLTAGVMIEVTWNTSIPNVPLLISEKDLKYHNRVEPEWQVILTHHIYGDELLTVINKYSYTTSV